MNIVMYTLLEGLDSRPTAGYNAYEKYNIIQHNKYSNFLSRIKQKKKNRRSDHNNSIILCGTIAICYNNRIDILYVGNSRTEAFKINKNNVLLCPLTKYHFTQFLRVYE